MMSDEEADGGEHHQGRAGPMLELVVRDGDHAVIGAQARHHEGRDGAPEVAPETAPEATYAGNSSARAKSTDPVSLARRSLPSRRFQ